MNCADRAAQVTPETRDALMLCPCDEDDCEPCADGLHLTPEAP